MDFSFSPEQVDIRTAAERICARFGDDYWLDIDVISQDGTADMRILVDVSGWNEAVPIEEPAPGA